VDVSPSTARVAAKQANSLALILNELTTNAAKYAASEDRTAHIGVRIVSDGDTLIEFRDDGPGFPDDVLRLERHNVGLYLVKLLVRDDLRGDCTLHNDGGAVITIRFKA
jgi:two-component sensor histidine kinase